MMAITTSSPAPLNVCVPRVITSAVFSPSTSATIVTGVPTLAGSREAMTSPVSVYTHRPAA